MSKILFCVNGKMKQVELSKFKRRKMFVYALETTEDGVLETETGDQTYQAGDFLAQDVDGSLYPIKKEKFHELYRSANQGEAVEVEESLDVQ
jgi:hypothetical protein